MEVSSPRATTSSNSLRGKHCEEHPSGRKARANEYAGYCCGFEVVLLIARRGQFRVRALVAIAVIDRSALDEPFHRQEQSSRHSRKG
jgi:hypothetical protein